MQFNADDWRALASLFNGVYHPDTDTTTPYAGYKPHVAEAPNGDMRDERCKECGGSGSCGSQLHHLGTWICGTCNGTGFVSVPNVAPPTTRYLHVAPKYNPPPWAMAYLARAHYEACRVAEALGVPAAYYPRVADGTLRVLDYDAAQCEPRDGLAEASPCTRCGRTVWAKGAPELCPGIGAWAQPEHTDFDLFTVNCYRSTPDDLQHHDARLNFGEGGWGTGGPSYHIGELGELVGLGPATPHRVPARPYRQRSIVYFAMPDHAALLPPTPRHLGTFDSPRQTVSEWLKERKAASRVYK